MQIKRVIAALVLLVSFPLAAFSQDQNPVRQELEHLVPAGNLDGWFIKGTGACYVSANLFLYIDGQAEMYLDYGFQSLLSSEYQSQKQQGVIVVDIYDMGDKDHALGIYSAERDETAKKLDIGADAYQSGQVLNFWKGPYYVKISVLGQIADVERVLPLFARATADKIATDTLFPERARRLQQDGLVPGTIKFTPKSFLGHSFITNTYSAEYRMDGGELFRLFISEYATPGDAMAAFCRYRDFVAKDNQKVFEYLTGVGETAFFYGDRVGKEYIVVKKGNCLCGITGARLGDPEKSHLKKIIP